MNGGFTRRGRIALLAAVLIASPPASLSGQATTVTTAGGMLHVHAPDFRFIEGPVLQRLRDGRSIRLALDLHVLGEPRGSALVTRRQTFTLSFDLWEERFAVSRGGGEARATLHPQATAAEAWCLEQLAVPISELRNLRRDAPFWVRLESRVESPAGGESEGLTLGRLIEVLSRRTDGHELQQTFDAGPFTLP